LRYNGFPADPSSVFAWNDVPDPRREQEIKGTEMTNNNTAAQLATQVLSCLESGDLGRLDELVSEDFIDHGAPPFVPTGREAYALTLQWLHKRLQLTYEVEDMVCSADKVAIRATAHGVDNSGHLGFAATGKPYTMATMHIFREEGGRLVEHWGVRDELSYLWQVGALTPPAPTPEMLEELGVTAAMSH
jgi:predicted ester cyclase